MSDRERAVREAVRTLHGFGLKIDSFSCHPEILHEICNETVFQMGFRGGKPCIEEVTYCGVPLRQVVHA